MTNVVKDVVCSALLLAVASGCGKGKNPAAPGPVPPQPHTQSLNGTVSIFGTTRHSLTIPRSGNLRVTLNWTGDVDLDLYLTNSNCQALYPVETCGVILASDSFVGTQETIAQNVSSGEVFALFVDSLSTTQAATYTIDIRID